MKHVPHVTTHRVSANENGLDATAKDFDQVFERQNTDLRRLSLQLTADAEKAEKCLILAMRDCFRASSLARHRVHTWARRMVIRNAIRLVWGTPNDILAEPELEFYLQPGDFLPEALRESVAILSLPELDRFAFVICVVERYSILDCALLLRKTPLEVYDATVRATSQVRSLEDGIDREAAETIPGNGYSLFWAHGNKLEGSFEPILH